MTTRGDPTQLWSGLQQRTMSPLEFLQESKQRPLMQRSQRWWDAMSVLGGAICGYIWFTYSSVRGMPRLKFLYGGRESPLDLLPTILLLALPFVLWGARVAIAQQIDKFMNRLSPGARKGVIGGTVVLGLLFLFDNSVLFIQREGLSVLTPILMIGIPVMLIWFREPIDGMLRPLQPVVGRIPTLIKLGIALALPFGVGRVLYNMGYNQYTLLNANIAIGLLATHIIVRRPAPERAGTTPRGGGYAGPSAASVLIALTVASWFFDVHPAWADDFFRDPFNLRDGLRTNDVADKISGLASSAVSVFVNGPELIHVATGGTSSPPADEPEQPTPEEIAANDAKKAWIEQRKLDLKAALDMKANLEAARQGYGGAGFDTSSHDRQIADANRRIEELRTGIANAGGTFDYTPAAHDPIGPGKEFVDAVEQNKALAEQQRLIAIKLEEERIEARKVLAKEQDRLEADRAAADAAVNSVTGIITDITVETAEDIADLGKQGLTVAGETIVDVASHPIDITVDTVKGMANDFKDLADKGAELEKEILTKLANAQEEVVSTVIETTKDAIKNPGVYTEAIGDTIVSTGETVVEGAVALGDAEIDVIMHPIDIGLKTVTTTASDVADLTGDAIKKIGEHARDHEKRNDFIKNVTAYDDLGKAMDPTLPVEERVGHGVWGGAKIALTANGLAPGTARAVAGQVVAKVGLHAAKVNAEPIIETAKVIHTMAKAMGIDLGDTKNWGKAADMYRKYVALTAPRND